MPLPEQTGCPKHGAGAELPGVWASLYTDISLWRQLDTSAQPSHMPGSAHGHCGLSPILSTITSALAPQASLFWADSSPFPSVRVQQEPPMGDGGELKTGYFQACRWGEGRPTRGGQSRRGHSHPWTQWDRRALKSVDTVTWRGVLDRSTVPWGGSSCYWPTISPWEGQGNKYSCPLSFCS